MGSERGAERRRTCRHHLCLSSSPCSSILNKLKNRVSHALQIRKQEKKLVRHRIRSVTKERNRGREMCVSSVTVDRNRGSGVKEDRRAYCVVVEVSTDPPSSLLLLVSLPPQPRLRSHQNKIKHLHNCGQSEKKPRSKTETRKRKKKRNKK